MSELWKARHREAASRFLRLRDLFGTGCGRSGFCVWVTFPKGCCQTLESVPHDVKMPRTLRACYGDDAGSASDDCLLGM